MTRTEAWEEIRKAADAIVAKGMSPTRAGAIEKAVERNPQLYATYLSATPDPITTESKPEPVSLHKGGEVSESAYGAIEKVVGEIRKQDPTLSEAEGFVQAVEENPTLYSYAMRADDRRTSALEKLQVQDLGRVAFAKAAADPDASAATANARPDEIEIFKIEEVR